MSFKDIYLDEVEEEVGRLEDQGLSRDEAYNRASETAYDKARDRVADMADSYRQRMKDERDA